MHTVSCRLHDLPGCRSDPDIRRITGLEGLPTVESLQPFLLLGPCVPCHSGETDRLLFLRYKSIGDKLTELSNVMDTFQSSMQSFCEEEGERFDIINDQMDTLVSNNTECCETINSKLEELGSLIEIMDIGDIAPIGYTTTTT